ncbi:hypothetical protein MKEN_01420400 [Mycena kentingensis (nom. inval.)]|nr:hypothetical protein MKEN_01420400 [Mycena kentingensis (nom. inval.)]
MSRNHALPAMGFDAAPFRTRKFGTAGTVVRRSAVKESKSNMDGAAIEAPKVLVIACAVMRRRPSRSLSPMGQWLLSSSFHHNHHHHHLHLSMSLPPDPVPLPSLASPGVNFPSSESNTLSFNKTNDLPFATWHGSFFAMQPIFFEVEKRIFQMPHFQFTRYSGIFRDTFPPYGEGKEGWDENFPIKLEGIALQDFECLVKVLYPTGSVPKTPVLDTSQWISVLKLASMWLFHDVRDLSLSQLDAHAAALDPVARIKLGTEQDVSAWFISGYEELARRWTSITDEEARELPFDAVLKIFRLREAAVATASGRYTRGSLALFNMYRDIQVRPSFEADIQRADAAFAPLSRAEGATFSVYTGPFPVESAMWTTKIAEKFRPAVQAPPAFSRASVPLTGGLLGAAAPSRTSADDGFPKYNFSFNFAAAPATIEPAPADSEEEEWSSESEAGTVDAEEPKVSINPETFCPGAFATEELDAQALDSSSKCRVL